MAKKHKHSFYVQIRIDIESDKKVDDDMIQEVVSEMDNNFSFEGEKVRIFDYEIKDIQEDFPYQNRK